MFYYLLMVNCYILLYINSQIWSLIVNYTYAFYKQAYTHNVDGFYIQKVSLTLLGSVECSGMNKWINVTETSSGLF